MTWGTQVIDPRPFLSFVFLPSQRDETKCIFLKQSKNKAVSFLSKQLNIRFMTRVIKKKVSCVRPEMHISEFELTGFFVCFVF